MMARLFLHEETLLTQIQRVTNLALEAIADDWQSAAASTTNSVYRQSTRQIRKLYRFECMVCVLWFPFRHVSGIMASFTQIQIVAFHTVEPNTPDGLRSTRVALKILVKCHARHDVLDRKILVLFGVTALEAAGAQVLVGLFAALEAHAAVDDLLFAYVATDDVVCPVVVFTQLIANRQPARTNVMVSSKDLNLLTAR